MLLNLRSLEEAQGSAQSQPGTSAGSLSSGGISQGQWRRKRKPLRSAQPVFIAPASLERAPSQAVIDRVPDFTAQTLGAAALSARIDREIELLMREDAERDDEEALLLIFNALD